MRFTSIEGTVFPSPICLPPLLSQPTEVLR